MRSVWTTEEIDAVERAMVDMTYAQAFLFVTVELNMPFLVAIKWLTSLAKSNPHSRLGCHYVATKSSSVFEVS